MTPHHQKIILIAVIFFVASAAPVSRAGETFKTSFDCAQARSRVERTICGNKDLADADQKMAELYKRLLPGLLGDEKNRLKHEQRNWIRTRELCGSSNVIIDCLKDQYDKRIYALDEYGKPSNPPSSEMEKSSGSVDIPYRIRAGELQVFGFTLRSKEISAKDDVYTVSFWESPGKRWVVIGYDEPFEKTLVWLYDRASKAAPVPVKALRVGMHFGVDWYGENVFAVYFGGMGYKTSQLFSVTRPDIYTQEESIVAYDPARDLYARFDFDKNFIFYITVGRAFHRETGEEKFPVKIETEDMTTAIENVENVRFGSDDVTITYQGEKGAVTEKHKSKIVESAKQ
jgi:uncharacterized protein